MAKQRLDLQNNVGRESGLRFTMGTPFTPQWAMTGVGELMKTLNLKPDRGQLVILVLAFIGWSLAFVIMHIFNWRTALLALAYSAFMALAWPIARKFATPGKR